MDEILNLDKILLFALFVMPGFITLKVYDLLIPANHKASSEQLIDAVAYSCINYAVMLFPIYLIESSATSKNHPTLYALFYVFVLLIFPVSVACAWVKLRNTEFLKDVFHHPKARPWDYVFGKRKSYWVVVTLKNGKMVGGMYHHDSFASGLPHDESIYLQEAWEINEGGAFSRKYDETAGLLILPSEMMTVEFFNLTEANDNDAGKQSREEGTSVAGGLPAGEGEAIQGASKGGVPANKG